MGSHHMAWNFDSLDLSAIRLLGGCNRGTYFSFNYLVFSPLKSTFKNFLFDPRLVTFLLIISPSLSLTQASTSLKWI